MLPPVDPRSLHIIGFDDRLVEVEALVLRLVGARERSGIQQMAHEHLSSGGKRIRARLALAIGDGEGAAPERMLPWAAAVEILHNATLVHDDIQDRDEIRRGQPTLWARHGVGQAINVGDFLLMTPFLALELIEVDAGTRWALTQALVTRAIETVRGQSLEMSLPPAAHEDWDAYLTAIRGKTGPLLALPVEGALIVAGTESGEARKVADAFVDIGAMYQLCDDIEDIVHGGSGRVPGSDLRSGKVNAAVLEHLQQEPGSREVLDVLGRRRLRDDAEAVSLAISAIRGSGAIERVIDRIHYLADTLLRRPDLLEHAGVRDVATELVRWILARAERSRSVVG
ncbi:MAG: polyprenyl synthetase family protein [Myxococcota bacterium]